MRAEGIPRSRRLTRASDVAAVLRKGRRHRTARLEIAWRPNELKHPRVAMVVPRHGRSIVRRNHLRRQLREIARRRLLPGLAPIDLVIRSHAIAYQTDFQELSADIEQWARSFSG